MNRANVVDLSNLNTCHINRGIITIITTSPTVASDFLLIGNVTQLQLQSKTVSWAQVTDKSSIFEITDVPVTHSTQTEVSLINQPCLQADWSEPSTELGAPIILPAE
jgi:curli biogenesis system outer membrane secretion channel CsgG